MQEKAGSSAELEASIASLAEEWEEQTRALHFIFRDLGLREGCFGWASPFEEALLRALSVEGVEARVMPLGAVRV
jgi:hypothetical protein